MSLNQTFISDFSEYLHYLNCLEVWYKKNSEILTSENCFELVFT